MALFTRIQFSIICGTLGALLFAAPAACGGTIRQVEPAVPSMLATPNQQLYCDTGYTVSMCTAQLKRLREVLSEMDLSQLGEWTWVLVRSDDWRPILRRVGRDPDSPAFTILDKRQTFLEEALFSPSPQRSRTLLATWHVPLDRFLVFTVTHELGHAVCRETDELRANEYAEDLRRTGRIACRTPTKIAVRIAEPPVDSGERHVARGASKPPARRSPAASLLRQTPPGHAPVPDKR